MLKGKFPGWVAITCSKKQLGILNVVQWGSHYTIHLLMGISLDLLTQQFRSTRGRREPGVYLPTWGGAQTPPTLAGILRADLGVQEPEGAPSASPVQSLPEVVSWDVYNTQI